jgi:hypothetical protein
MPRELYDSALMRLEQAKRSIRCSELTALLEGLGFEVRDGRKQGHRVIVHDGIDGFTSDSFTCGHGKNPEIKPAYTGKLIRLLRRYENELIEYLEEQQ